MIIQNKKQRKNAKRRSAILENRYVDPFDYYAARKFLEEEFMRMRNDKEKKNIQILNAEKYRSASTAFSKTPDVDEAAGALLNAELGQEIPYFYEDLLHGKAVRIHEKLKLLVNGEHKGVQLMKAGWKMSKKRMNKLEK